MQHRGQEGAGIAVLSGNTILFHKNVGLVSEVFSGQEIKGLSPANMAVGHTRYSTTGNNTIKNVQPFLTEYLVGRIATVHNGNITNAKEIKTKLENCGLDFIASSDSEIVSSLIAYKALQKNDIVAGVIDAAKELEGAFSLVILSNDNKLIAVRDPNGFRPFCIGKSPFGIAVASESCALDSCGFTFLRDIKPGEIVVIENGEISYSEVLLSAKKVGICIF